MRRDNLGCIISFMLLITGVRMIMSGNWILGILILLIAGAVNSD